MSEMVSKQQNKCQQSTCNVDTPHPPSSPTSSQQSVWLERQSSARCGESGQSGIKTPLFEMGALHSLENLFIETEEEEGRKNKHTAPSMHLLSVCKLCVQRGFAPKADGALELIWRKHMALKNIQQNKTYLFIYFLR